MNGFLHFVSKVDVAFVHRLRSVELWEGWKLELGIGLGKGCYETTMDFRSAVEHSLLLCGWLLPLIASKEVIPVQSLYGRTKPTP